MNNIYRVWFDSGSPDGVCCVLVSAPTEKSALELAREQMKDFPKMEEAPYQISIFNINDEHASIC